MYSPNIFRGLALSFILLGGIAANAQRPAQGPISRDVIQPEKLGYRLVWEDEFNGTKLDTTKWRHRGLGARALAFVSEDAVEVKDGYVYLWAKRDANGRMRGSAIGTQRTFMSRYGYYECGARGQKSWGQWGAFWLQSNQISAGEDPAVYGAEIDVMECFCDDNGQLLTEFYPKKAKWQPKNGVYEEYKEHKKIINSIAADAAALQAKLKKRK